MCKDNQNGVLKFLLRLFLGVVAARDGALTFMVGATLEDYERANTILENMAKNVVHCGSTGTGQVCLCIILIPNRLVRVLL